MSHELAYFLKVNVAIALFYAFYRLFFYKDTFFQWRRMALLSFFAISLLYPLLNIEQWIKGQKPMAAMVDLYSTVILPEIVISPSSDVGWQNLITSSLAYLYMGVAALLLLRFFVQLFEIIKLGLRTSITTLQGTEVHLLQKPQGPFSFFKWIFICPKMHNAGEMEEILTHEQTHARQWHSIDILFGELMCIACWFNPFVWLMKREIRNNLEFMADHRVLETGHDCKTYQYHLLGLTHQKKVATLYNSFNVLPLKIRIRMMNKKRTKQIGRTKYLMFIPLALLLLLVSNIEAIARSTEALVSNIVQTELHAQEELSYEEANFYTYSTLYYEDANAELGHQTPQKKVDDNDVVFDVVEEMPNFPGGQQELMTFLSRNIKYPQVSIDNKEQGRVIVEFIVDKEGNITKPKVVRSITPELDAEALRVMSVMPKWTPGKQRGEAVKVRYTMPVMFRLGPDTPKENSNNSGTQTPGDDTVFEIVEEMPNFPGGQPALMKYISENIQYPAEAKAAGEQGRVILQFIIDAEGNITQPRIVRSISPSLDQEAIRLVNNMGKWIPGKQRGKAVAVKYALPVNFTLSK